MKRVMTQAALGGGGIRSCLQYSGLFYAESDISGYATIQVCWCLQSSFIHVDKVFFPRFYQHHFDATFFTFFSDELTSRHERKTPWKLRKDCIWFFFFSCSEWHCRWWVSTLTVFFISSGLNEFTLIGNRHIVTMINAYGSPPSYTCILNTCTKRLHVFFFFEVVHYHGFDFTLWMSHGASLLLIELFFS